MLRRLCRSQLLRLLPMASIAVPDKHCLHHAEKAFYLQMQLES